ncbi:uncharacterized protein LOC131682080 [Topomyia yanbarensis]|uniref:uncharacterized protein LOC131682080 n=1 Tax=Topomyia yanbarensis TaxID=2498891 RepID=UPI00273C70AC|nr:uncharacterized protein LOC131682080 [Topomyia yanbarensis]XP_058819257.1 uncharacterized protein LOC131682080 [Topomyia yanbarensis]XP_058819258.1 uncharacterized protein LOC131682080 [Topomyia yanbarensis]XP_058819259.1 uncharacterized protein LOC131682080 [Topomyia yanbarensis]XP_058819260.1 uncharacterized protein LOC131682080 [Topomyia yanbarensis]XP_058819261.1 uncharacterized protein LOC131682080 [Topomyia yanbarensis]XP_058819262.1 uncharacterized protein LOC131682080 [Topomyia yan
MGNYCSSGQTKKDKDNASEKSEESPSYQPVDKNKSNGSKEAPLAAPEPISDGSGTGPISNNSTTNDGNIADASKAQLKSLQNVQSITLSADSNSNSPMAASPPCDIPAVQRHLPHNLTPLYGKPTTSRRTEKYKKIVLYILAADDGYQMEKTILRDVYKGLNRRCQSRGFELHVSDLHVLQVKGSSFDVNKWLSGPLEAQGGHDLAANCLAEIARQSGDSYLIPVLFLSSTLGDPLLPLTIESQDFAMALQTAENNSDDRAILEKWYTLDDRSQPACYRLNVTNNSNLTSEASEKELSSLLKSLIDIFPKELRDSYLTTVVEQEINNTVLINQELSKRCIWIQNSIAPLKVTENSSSVDAEMVRRLGNIQSELKNHLAEKHILRIPPTAASQDQFATQLDNCLSSEIDLIIDEHTNKYSIPLCTYGVDRRLLSEVEEVNRHSRVLNENCANFTVTDRVKEYLTSHRRSPLVIYGKTGAGKSVLVAKISQNVHTWLPDSHLVLRYSNLTPLSSDVTALLGSITEQISVLVKGVPTRCNHTVESYSETLKQLIDSTKQQITILIDSVDSLRDLDNLDWLPLELLENVKLVLTVTSSCASQDLSHLASEDAVLKQLKEKIGDAECFLHLTPFTQEQWEDVLCFGGGDIYSANGALQLPDSWKKSNEKISVQAKILWWLAWLGVTDLSDTSVSHISEKVFIILEDKFTDTVTRFIISLLLAAREGLFETEIITLIRNSNLVTGSTTKLWTHFCWKMGPLFLHNKNIIMVDRTLRDVAGKRYESHIKDAHKILYDYFEKQPNSYTDKRGKDTSSNIRKFMELPYHRYKMEASDEFFARSSFLTDLSWIHEKLVATGCVHLLNDICLVNLGDSSSKPSLSHLVLLQQFIEVHFKALNYDGQQLYSLLHAYIDTEVKVEGSVFAGNEVLKKWLDFIDSSTVTYLQKLELSEPKTDRKDSQAEKVIAGHDLIVNLNIDGYYVISLSTNREEICVWDVANCSKVRTLLGVPQPSAICPVGDYGVAVLCRREIRIVDLDEGKFKVTLKGVMNQKMPYFGLHDSSHLVCLSRNRMYVNLMNIESGDCVTTFKAGEDRFLNSLLVSGDGRILVCGDETQKPFPLLVWHLSQKKLLYDLRIPHHDFITSLSAITHEGSYVCVVAKELAEPSPNFIVVYDLQSGTLFKKWKPACNTVSLAISQANTCVIAGLEDARILIWDLVTGNCRCTLTGHCAPVTILKLDPSGKVLLSSDKEGRDMSVRLWELDSGNPMAVYTPQEKITTCEILTGGRYLAIALENRANIVTLKLRGGNNQDAESSAKSVVYGKPENTGKVFDLRQ